MKKVLNTTLLWVVTLSMTLDAQVQERVKTFHGFEFTPLIKEGDVFPLGTFGTLYTVDQKVIKGAWGGKDANTLFDFGTKAYMLTHIETTPGGVYITTLEHRDNKVVATNTKNIDLSSVAGIVSPCAASKTPWNTHLGGEEDYDFNSLYFDSKSPFYIECNGSTHGVCKRIKQMKHYLNSQHINPYNYGSSFEISVDKEGNTQLAKHYVTGKYTPELALVMPDQKTIYITDDGEDKGLYKFVNDTKIEGFSPNWQGTLYMARLKQVSKKSGGNFDITWIKLAQSSDTKVKSMIERSLKVSDMFDIQLSERCSQGFKAIREDGRRYCLRLREGALRSKLFSDDTELKQAAAFLETRKYGAFLGATTELRKEEGLAYNAKENAIYLSMTEITKSMQKDHEDNEPNDHVRLKKNRCGAVYRLMLDKNYNATKMKAVLVGVPLEENDPSQEAALNACSTNAIANPDNLLFSDDQTLLIAEDSTLHYNNILWAYNIDTQRLTKIATLPTGAEVAGMVRAKLFGKEMLFFNVQHPFEAKSVNAAGVVVNGAQLKLATGEDKKGYVGYIDNFSVRLLP